MLKVFGAVGSGSIPIEATLMLLGIPYELVEGVTWVDEAARKRVESVNPMRQVPALVFPSGEIMTESAAILIHLADAHPHARLAPSVGDPKRAQYLRWMAYVSSAIYALFWIKGDPMRIAASKADEPRVIDRVHDRIAACWASMDKQIDPGRYILGDDAGAIACFEKVLAEHPAQPDALFNLGMVRFGCNDVQAAEQCFKRPSEDALRHALGYGRGCTEVRVDAVGASASHRSLRSRGCVCRRASDPGDEARGPCRGISNRRGGAGHHRRGVRIVELQQGRE
ncbi:MAG: glutathione S-transferase family protein [Rhodospirillaceae bacterium]|nr:glutathione S-transferase family protein [Rhodospirillaceae bacterium]